MIGDLVRTRTIGILDPSQARLERLSAAFEHEYATLFRFAYFLTADRNTAEDLVQEAFLRVYRAGSRVNPAHVRAFARKVILNLNRSAFRRAGTGRRLDASFLATSSPSVIDPAERAGDRDVRDAVLGLPAKTRACMALRYYEDMTEADIADALEMSVVAVKKQIQRGLERLRTTLGEVTER